jgi:hypothetical protein
MLEGQMLERSICFPGAIFVRRVAPQGISGKEKSRLIPMASLFDWIAAARPKTLVAWLCRSLPISSMMPSIH